MFNENDELKWFVLYTKSRYEKKVNSRLTDLNITTYLPLKKTIRKWSDRKKVVDMPLINSYIFVKTKRDSLYDLIKIEGVTRYVSFSGRPVVVRQKEIDILKKFLEDGTAIDIIDGVPKVGKQVKFTSGFFKDYEGKILKVNRKNQLQIEIESINKTLVVTVDIDTLKLQ
jgi:transcription antitermination factor NusG